MAKGVKAMDKADTSLLEVQDAIAQAKASVATALKAAKSSIVDISDDDSAAVVRDIEGFAKDLEGHSKGMSNAIQGIRHRLQENMEQWKGEIEYLKNNSTTS